MRSVKQKHAKGCVVAALSMLSGIGYNKVFRILHPNYRTYKRPYPALYTEDILKGAVNLNLDIKFSFTKQDITKLKTNALIVVNCGSSRHAFVWDAQDKRILNPWHKKDIRVFDKSYIKKTYGISYAGKRINVNTQ